MAAFEYIVLDPKGREKKGVIEGDTARQVRQMLRDKGMMPIQIEAAAQREKTKDQPGRVSSRRPRFCRPHCECGPARR